MDRHRTRRQTYGALLALTTAGALLLTGCSADENHVNGPNYTSATRAPAPSQAQGDETAAPSDHLSTFALDVDTASYGYARRTLADGGRPDPSTIRPEEFVNSFRQDYRTP